MKAPVVSTFLAAAHLDAFKNAVGEAFVGETLLHRYAHDEPSDEQSIGSVQENYLAIAFEPVLMRLMKQIIAIFDPNNALNTGKIFD